MFNVSYDCMWYVRGRHRDRGVGRVMERLAADAAAVCYLASAAAVAVNYVIGSK